MATLDDLRAGRLAGCRRLDLSCGLSEFPREIYDLADSLEILNLSGNALTSLPDDLPRLHRLRVIFCSDNPFTVLPEVLGRCPGLTMVGFKACRIQRVPAASLPSRLRWLILTDNAVADLPDELGRRPLQKLMLAGNRLERLPESLAGCPTLELFRISANRFATLPAWIFTLPRLAWFACAGNPALQRAGAVETSTPAIPWNALSLQERLGEGASGIIHRATWHRPEGLLPVAVKCFKGAMTSDGLPEDEMAASLGAGAHPGLIPVLGRASGAQGEALVMPLIDPAFRILAGPPSLESCTRDVYPDGLALSLSTTLALVRRVADTCRHLHERSINHGDLYGHNLLWDGLGTALVSDFGGATRYGSGGGFEPIEVRAFGILLGELLERTVDPVPAGLTQVQQDCVQEVPAQRPDFAVIGQRLATI